MIRLSSRPKYLMVARLLIQGKTYKEIGARVNLSVVGVFNVRAAIGKDQAFLKYLEDSGIDTRWFRR